MKAAFILCISSFCLSQFSLAGEVNLPKGATAVGILPVYKQGKVVAHDERNPFGTVVSEVEEVEATGVEAAKISAILESLPLSGVSRDLSGQVRTVLLGDVRLEAGALVPQLIEGQTDELVVESMTETEIVIGWRLEAGRKVGQPRVLRRKIDLEPKVMVMLPGQVLSAAGSQKSERKSVVIVPGRSAAPPNRMVPISGLPPAAQ